MLKKSQETKNQNTNRKKARPTCIQQALLHQKVMTEVVEEDNNSDLKLKRALENGKANLAFLNTQHHSLFHHNARLFLSKFFFFAGRQVFEYDSRLQMN